MKDPEPDEPAALVAALRREAIRLGFARLGIAPAVSPQHHAAFQGWLARGLGGVMQPWLERHEPLRRDLDAILSGARSVVMLATDYALGAEPDGESVPAGHGRVARYARGDDYHEVLRGRLNDLARWLEERVPGTRARGVVDSAPVAERDYASLAGLGWFGKNTMLIDPTAGSYFLLGSLVTDLELPVDRPLETDHCGTCTACLEACPTDALPAPRVLDASKCISAITIELHGSIPQPLREGMGDMVFGCDICQEVCPWNRHAPGSEDPTFQPRNGLASLDLTELLRLDPRGFRDSFRGSPILRAKRHGLLRSAAIALGNRPHPPAFEGLAEATRDVDATVRGAAAWALGRWMADGVMGEEARRVLEARLEVETDAHVRAELSAAIDGYGQEPASSRSSSISEAGSRPGPSMA